MLDTGDNAHTRSLQAVTQEVRTIWTKYYKSEAYTGENACNFFVPKTQVELSTIRNIYL